MQNARFGVHKGFASLQSVPATCMEVSQACKVSLQPAWRFRTSAMCPCNLHGRFARVQGSGSEFLERIDICFCDIV